MRILHVIATAEGWGGLERCVTDLSGIQSGSHTVAVAGAEGILARLPSGVQGLVVPMRHSRRDPRLLWALRRAVRWFRPDVIHAHAGKGAALVNTVRWCLPRIPCVATIHGTKKHLGFLSNFDRVIAVSRRAGESLGAIGYTVIWNAIPPMARPAAPADLTPFPFLGEGKPVFAAVGRLVEEKALDVLVRAMNEGDGRLWIIGDGPLRSSLEALAAKTGCADRIWFAGFRTDVALLMCLADVMVISSRREGFPLAMVEMLHLRRPVVGTRVAGVEEILPDQWLCDPDDVPGLAGLLRKAGEDRGVLERDMDPVFELAARELRLDRAAHRIEAVYREAIENAATR